jgi:hypothetical protein
LGAAVDLETLHFTYFVSSHSSLACPFYSFSVRMQDPREVANPPAPSSQSEDEQPIGRPPSTRRASAPSRVIDETSSQADADEAPREDAQPSRKPSTKRTSHRVVHESSSQPDADNESGEDVQPQRKPSARRTSRVIHEPSSEADADDASTPTLGQGQTRPTEGSASQHTQGQSAAQPEPTLKRQPATRKGSQAKAKRVASLHAAESFGENSDAPSLPLELQPLDEATAETARASSSIYRWNKAIGSDGLGIKRIKVIRPTKMKGRVDYLRDLLSYEPVDQRQFRVKSCKPPDKNKGGLWSFILVNDGPSTTPEHRLRLSFAGMTLCPDERAAHAFASHMCKYIDRFPAPPEMLCVQRTGAGGRATQMANMLEIVAIADFFHGTDWPSSIYRQKQGIIPSLPKVNIDKPPNDQAQGYAQTISDTGLEGEPAMYSLNISHTIDRVDMDLDIIPAQTQFPGLWPELPTVESLRADVKTKKLRGNELHKYVQAAKAIRNVQMEMHGIYGTRQDLFKLKDSLLLQYTVFERRTDKLNFAQYRTRTGPYNHEKVAHFRGMPQFRRFELEPSMFVRKDVEGKLPKISIESASKTRVAFVLEALMSSFYLTHDIVQAWRTGCAVADQISTGLVSSDQIKQEFCQCAEEDRSHVVHVCQTCLANEICSNMERNSWDGLVCKLCISDEGKTDDLEVSGAKLRWQLTQLVKRDKSIKATNIEKLVDKLYDHLESFRDAEDRLVDTWTSTPREEHCSSERAGRTAPLVASIDAILQISVNEQNKVAYHDNINNLCITADYLNRFKGKFPPRLVGLVGLQRDLESKSEAQDIMSEEHDNLLNQFDHLYVITCSYSFVHKQKRLQMGVQKAREHVRKMTRAEASQPEAEQLFTETDIPFTKAPTWSRKEIDLINNIIAQMELKFQQNVMRSGDGAPWLWIRHHMPATWSWSRLWRMFIGRLQRMRLFCNRKHETIDSVITLFLEGVYQHLKFKGRDEFLNLPMTIYSKHALCLSIGHKHHGQQMRTGFKTLQPTDLSQHYDENMNNICFETQISNFTKWDYPEGDYDKIRTDMRSIHLKTAHYDVPHTCTRFDFDRIHRKKSAASQNDLNESDWDESDNEWLDDGFNDD